MISKAIDPVIVGSAVTILSEVPKHFQALEVEKTKQRTHYVNAASEAFKSVIEAKTNYDNKVQEETYKREVIQTDKEVSIKAIEESSKILRSYLESIFSERKRIIDGNFALLEQALAQNNMQMASLAMDSINKLVEQSPIAQAKELIANMNNPQITHIEI
jgi:hypothetical protein